LSLKGSKGPKGVFCLFLDSDGFKKVWETRGETIEGLRNRIYLELHWDFCMDCMAEEQIDMLWLTKAFLLGDEFSVVGIKSIIIYKEI